MMKQEVRKVRRSMLLAGAATAMLWNAGAQAQDAAATEPQQEEASANASLRDIVVTGTRLRGVAPVGSAMIGIGADTIERSNALTTTQLLQEVPQVYNLGISDASRNQSGGAFNTSFGTAINIRGLGPFSTLTLIDSHRSVPQGSTGFAVDPSVIPTLAIERVEIVADGASAIYGSDAVAGVANIILRRNFDGLRLTGRYGFGDEYNEHQFGFLAGKTWSTGRFTISAERQFRDSLSGRDRDFFRADQRGDGGGDYRSTTCNPGNILLDGVSYAIPEGGVTAGNANLLIPNTSNRCDTLKVADLLPRQKRTSAVFTFDQELTDWLRIKADGFITERTFSISRDFATNTLRVPNTNAFFVAPPGTDPANVVVEYSFAQDYPQTVNSGHSRARQISGGFEADLPYSWQLAGSMVVGNNKDYSQNNPNVVAAALTRALASSDPATAFDPFGLNRTSPATIASILSGISSNQGNTDFRDYQLQMDGPLFTLPGGEVRFAVGYEHQYLRIRPTNLSGPRTNILVRTKDRDRKVDSAYAELFVPIVGSGNAMPMLQRLDLNIAGRYDKYDDVGDTWNPKVGVNYSPVSGLKFHGSYGTSFRAPTLSQLYGTGGGVFALINQSYTDPACGGCLRPGVVSSGENPDLVPEEATTYSFGVDWTPAFAPGLSISLNYFDVFYSNQVQAYVSDLSLLNREDQFAGTGIIMRNPTPEFMAALNAAADREIVLPSTVYVYVDGRSKNAGDTVAKGFDFQLNYTLRTDNAGTFNLGWNGSYFTKYETSIATGGKLNDVLNTIYNPLRFRSRASLRWTKGAFDLGFTVNYVNSYTNNLVTPSEKVDPYTLVDMRAEYDLGSAVGMKDLRFSVDVRNLFNTDPSYANVAQSRNGGGAYDVTVANPLGRVVTIGLTAGF